MKNTIKQSNLISSINQVIEKVDQFQKECLDESSKAGEIKRKYQSIKSVLIKVNDSKISEGNNSTITSSGLGFFAGQNHLWDQISINSSPSIQLINYTGGSVDAYYSTINAACHVFKFEPPVTLISNEELVKGNEKYIQLFKKINESLANTYEAIWEILISTRSDPCRASLFLMRQAIDHFFGKIAPDKEVRKSIYWKLKKGKNENLVTRSERIKYAANIRVFNPVITESLIANTSLFLKNYKELNLLHKRGLINDTKCRETLKALKFLLESWVDAILIE